MLQSASTTTMVRCFSIFSNKNVLNITFRRLFFRNDSPRIPQHNGMRRYIKIHISQWSNQDIVANRNFSHHTCITANPHLVTDNWIASSLTPELHSNCSPMIKRAIPSTDRFVVYDHVATMNQQQPLSNSGMPANLNPCPY